MGRRVGGSRWNLRDTIIIIFRVGGFANLIDIYRVFPPIFRLNNICRKTEIPVCFRCNNRSWRYIRSGDHLFRMRARISRLPGDCPGEISTWIGGVPADVHQLPREIMILINRVWGMAGGPGGPNGDHIRADPVYRHQIQGKRSDQESSSSDIAETAQGFEYFLQGKPVFLHGSLLLPLQFTMNANVQTLLVPHTGKL